MDGGFSGKSKEQNKPVVNTPGRISPDIDFFAFKRAVAEVRVRR